MDVTLDAGDTSVNTTDKVPTFMELTFWEEKQKISKENPSGWWYALQMARAGLADELSFVWMEPWTAATQRLWGGCQGSAIPGRRSILSVFGREFNGNGLRTGSGDSQLLATLSRNLNLKGSRAESMAITRGGVRHCLFCVRLGATSWDKSQYQQSSYNTFLKSLEGTGLGLKRWRHISSPKTENKKTGWVLI